MKIEDLDLDLKDLAEAIDLARVKFYKIHKIGSRIKIVFYDKNKRKIGQYDV